MAQARICLIHGAATTSRIWHDVVGALPPELRISCPDRVCSGSLDTEVGALATLCTDAVVVGVSGGATLGWELAARGVRFRAAILHEPAVGSLVPGLLAPMAAAFISGGVDAFGATLYGSAWRPAYAPADPDAVASDLEMFQAFEPRPPVPGSGPITITVGERSPQIRHDAARLLAERFALPVQVLPGCGHAVHLDQPIQLAALIVAAFSDPPRRRSQTASATLRERAGELDPADP